VCCGAPLITVGPITQGVIVGGLGGVIPPSTDPDDRLVAVNQDPVNELEGKGASLQADWDLGWGTVTSITSYREQSDFNDTDVDFTSVDLATQPQQVDYETFTQELRIAGEFESGIGVFNWLAGGFYFDEEVNFFQQTTFGDDFRAFGDIQLAALGTSFLEVEGATQLANALTTGPTALFPEFLPASGATSIPFGAGFASGTGFTGDYLLDNRSYSLFFQTDWELTDRLTLTGGVSYVNDRKDAIGDTVQTEPFQNADLSQFATSGGSFVAATIFGGLIGTPFDAANPTPFFVAAQTLAATDPATFGAARAGAVAGAQGALAGDPTLNPLLGFTGLTALQFIPVQTPFPNPPGVTPDDEISLVDDGFATDDAINVTARIAYDVTDDLNVYFSYATGYKAPAVNLSQDAQPPVIGTNGLAVGRFAAAEDVTLFEIGLKTRFDGGYINVALFDQTIDNFQSNTFTGTGFVFANAGEQSVRGFEIDASYSPWEPLNLFAGLTYLDPDFPSFISFPCPSAGLVSIARADVLATCADPAVSTVDISGTDPSGIHEISLTTAATYTHEMANGSTITGRVEYLFESETSLYELGNGTEPMRRISTINANLKYAMENGFSINVWGRNLNDDDSLITFFPSVAQAGSYNAYVAAPRQMGVSIRKDF
jgi:iron complex outermembrane receptor protein